MSGWPGPPYDMTVGAPPTSGGAGFPPPYGASPPMPGAVPSAGPMSGHLGGVQSPPPAMGTPAPPPSSGFAPIAGLPLDANVAAQFGMAYGAQALNAGQQYLHSNVDRFVNVGQLKRYFAVSNEYVARKLGIILFPFRHRVRRAPPLGVPRVDNAESHTALPSRSPADRTGSAAWMGRGSRRART